MQWIPPEDRLRIRQTTARLGEGECIVAWQWPAALQYVMIASFAAGEEAPAEQLTEQRLKLFTREEYKVRGGYRVPVDFIGARYFRVYPCVMEDGKLLGLRQRDEDNLARASGGRAKIRFVIRYGSAWFGKFKPVRIRLFCEMAVPKEALCYVKKQGGLPLHPDDGTRYPLLRDLPPGVTELPPFEVGRSDQVRLFLTSGQGFGDLFEIVPGE